MKSHEDKKKQLARSIIEFLEKNEVPFRREYEKEREKIRSKSRLQGNSLNVTRVNR